MFEYAVEFGADLAELLHDLDQADGLPGRDRVAFADVGFFVRARLAVEDAGKGGNDLVAHEFSFVRLISVNSRVSVRAGALRSTGRGLRQRPGRPQGNWVRPSERKSC